MARPGGSRLRRAPGLCLLKVAYAVAITRPAAPPAAGRGSAGSPWPGIAWCRPTHAPWFGQIELREVGREQLSNATLEYQDFIDHFPTTRMFYGDCLLYYKYPPTKAVAEPLLWQRFDWSAEVQECSTSGCTNLDGGMGRLTMRRRDPRTVFIKPAMLGHVSACARAWFNRTHRDRVLVVGQDDSNITTAAGWLGQRPQQMIAEAGRFFKAIWFEAKDIDLGGVRTMPIGLQENYLREPGAVGAAKQAMASACLDGTCKPRQLLAAWGAFSPTETLCIGQKTNHSCASRRRAEAWLATPAAAALGAERVVTGKLQWWGTLASYRFLLSPLGAGIQSPKSFEALLVLTIPITQRVANGHVFPAHDDLLGLGFPIAVVEDFVDISASGLEQWWRDLSPRLISFRRNCLTTEGYWKLLTLQIEVCS